MLMPTRNVVLTDHHQSVIERLVGSGRYQNASEVLREGLRLIEQRDALEQAKLDALRQLARAGFDDLDEGRFVELPAQAISDHLDRLGRLAAEAGGGSDNEIG